MQNPNTIGTSKSRQTVIHSTNQALEAVSLKPGPRLLLARIVLWSGKKGACWYAVGTMAARLGVSERQIQRWKKELITKGFLAERVRHGGPPYLIPYPCGLEDYQSESNTDGGDCRGGDKSVTQKEHEATKEKTLVGDPHPAVEFAPTEESEHPTNVFESELQDPHPQSLMDEPKSIVAAPFSASCPVSKPVNSKGKTPQSTTPLVDQQRTRTTRLPNDVQDLVEQIERVTNDHHSRGAFIRIARNVDEQTIYQALSSVRCAMDCGTIYRPGAYFIGVIKAITGFSFKSGTSVTPTEKKRSVEPWCGLGTLQLMHPHLKVEPLWQRYRDLVTGADLERFRLFLQIHSDEIWREKPQYRRV